MIYEYAKPLPMVTSEEECVSRNLLIWLQQRGSQSRTCCRRGRREPASTSTWVRRRRATRPTRPFTGSMWLAIRTHLQHYTIVRPLKTTVVHNYLHVTQIPGLGKVLLMLLLLYKNLSNSLQISKLRMMVHIWKATGFDCQARQIYMSEFPFMLKYLFT